MSDYDALAAFGHGSAYLREFRFRFKEAHAFHVMKILVN